MCKQLTKEFRSGSVTAGMMKSGEEGDNGLRLTADIC